MKTIVMLMAALPALVLAGKAELTVDANSTPAFPKDAIYVWGYVLDKIPTVCPFVSEPTDISLETATRYFGAKRAIYMNTMFDRAYVEKHFPKWDHACLTNCIDNRLTEKQFALLKDIPEVWCAIQHGDRLGSAKRIATFR